MTTKARPVIHAPVVAQSKSLRILCAEDDEQVAMLLKFALERGGHRVEQAENGLRAFERIAAEPNSFDVLVTDHQMPALSGLKLVERVRRIAFNGRIVVHSSELHARDAAAYRALGVECILSKPARPDELLAAIEQVGTVT